jgi:hypothetical protein
LPSSFLFYPCAYNLSEPAVIINMLNFFVLEYLIADGNIHHYSWRPGNPVCAGHRHYYCIQAAAPSENQVTR